MVNSARCACNCIFSDIIHLLIWTILSRGWPQRRELIAYLMNTFFFPFSVWWLIISVLAAIDKT
ncbi:hypothetical protein T10_959 [Trichinella papuae]|uniref:Transmembrane protein n=1 Tax=Trichinella papuae TaxID=268474 RepID=A0A0V1M008_9BILA|nr:hypothetical protein T10_959 [Trichinella papuae]